jgi:plastocyanin
MTTSPISRRGWQKLALALAIGAVGLALIGARGQTAAADPAAHASASARVSIEDFAFHPPKLKVVKGTRVVFANASGVTHTVTREGGFDSGLLKPGKSFAVRFGQKGTFRYRCLIHPSMHGRVVVD